MFDGEHYNGSLAIFRSGIVWRELFIGDPVGGFLPRMTRTEPAVQLATVGSPILGAIVGILDGEPSVPVTRDLPIYHPLSTKQYLAVCSVATYCTVR